MRFLLLFLTLATTVSCQQPPKQEATDTSVEVAGVNPYYSRTDTTVLNVPDSVWKTVLPDSIYQVGRKAATERAFTGKYWNFESLGTYYCAVCGNKLFRSDS